MVTEESIVDTLIKQLNLTEFARNNFYTHEKEILPLNSLKRMIQLLSPGVSPEGVEDIVSEVKENLIRKGIKEKMERDTIKKQVRREVAKKNYSPKSGVLEDTEIERHIKDLMPIVDYVTGDICFIDQKTMTLENVSEDLFLAKSGVYQSKKEMISESAIVELAFKPGQPSIIKKKNLVGVSIDIFNLYTPPPWTEYVSEGDKALMPNLIKDLFTNIFPNEQDREFVFQWIYRAVEVQKNETILCLIGSQGVGKDFLVNLISHGVGLKYFEKADQSIISEKFNSQVRYCRLLFLDEVAISNTAEENKLKGLTSTNISYQAKGKDSITIESFLNIVLANNNKDAINVKPGDRRLSVPRLGNTKLDIYFNEKYGKKEGPAKLNELYSYIFKGEKDENGIKIDKPHDDIINFFLWLRERYEGTEVAMQGSIPYQSDYYQELVLLGMKEWQVKIFDMLTDDNLDYPIISFKDMRKMFDPSEAKSIPYRQRSWEVFFEAYKYEGRYLICEVVTRIEGKTPAKYFVLTDEYIKAKYPDKEEFFLEKIEEFERGGDLEAFGINSSIPKNTLEGITVVEADEEELEEEEDEDEELL